MNKKIVLGVVWFSVASVACSSGSDGGDSHQGKQQGGSSAGTGTSQSPTTPPPSQAGDKQPASSGTACVTPTSKPNDKGIGGYCDAKTKCTGDMFCTGDVGAPEGATFCTILCEKDDECGQGATCFHEGRGNACVPNVCLEKK